MTVQTWSSCLNYQLCVVFLRMFALLKPPQCFQHNIPISLTRSSSGSRTARQSIGPRTSHHKCDPTSPLSNAARCYEKSTHKLQQTTLPRFLLLTMVLRRTSLDVPSQQCTGLHVQGSKRCLPKHRLSKFPAKRSWSSDGHASLTFRDFCLHLIRGT